MTALRDIEKSDLTGIWKWYLLELQVFPENEGWVIHIKDDGSFLWSRWSEEREERIDFRGELNMNKEINEETGEVTITLEFSDYQYTLYGFSDGFLSLHDGEQRFDFKEIK